MNGDQFEDYMVKLLNGVGYNNVQHTPYSADHGLDAYGKTADGIPIGWQFKNYKNTVPYRAVEEAISGARFYGTKINVVLTNSTFSNNTIKTCKQMNKNFPQQPIKLIDRSNFPEILKHYEQNKPLLRANIKKQKAAVKHYIHTKLAKQARHNRKGQEAGAKLEQELDKFSHDFDTPNSRLKTFAYYAISALATQISRRFQSHVLLNTIENNSLVNCETNVSNISNDIDGLRRWSYNDKDLHEKYDTLLTIKWLGSQVYIFLIVYFPPEILHKFKQRHKYPSYYYDSFGLMNGIASSVYDDSDLIPKKVPKDNTHRFVITNAYYNVDMTKDDDDSDTSSFGTYIIHVYGIKSLIKAMPKFTKRCRVVKERQFKREIQYQQQRKLAYQWQARINKQKRHEKQLAEKREHQREQQRLERKRQKQREEVRKAERERVQAEKLWQQRIARLKAEHEARMKWISEHKVQFYFMKFTRKLKEYWNK